MINIEPAKFLDEFLCSAGDITREVNGINTLKFYINQDLQLDENKLENKR